MAAEACWWAILVTAAILLPVVAYAAARCAGYGWVRGQWQFFEEMKKNHRSQQEMHDDGDAT